MIRPVLLFLVMVISAFAGDADFVEEQVEKLVREKKWDEALEKVKEGVAENPGDWRLRYLYGILLQQSFREDEALVIFRELFRVSGELPRLEGLDKRGMELPKYREHFDLRKLVPREFLKWRDNWIDYGKIAGIDQANVHQLDRIYGKSALFALPRSASELRYQSGVRVFALLQMIPDPKVRREKLRKWVEGAKGEYRRFLRVEIELDEVRTEFEEQVLNADDPGPAMKFLLAIRDWRYAWPEETKELAFARLLSLDPIFVLKNLGGLGGTNGVGLFEERQLADVALEIFWNLDDETKREALNLIPTWRYDFGYGFDSTSDTFKHQAAVKAEYLRLECPISSVETAAAFFKTTIREQNAEEALRILNLVAPAMEEASSIHYGRPTGMEGSMMFSYRPPYFPPQSAVSHFFRPLERGRALFSLNWKDEGISSEALEEWKMLSRVSEVDMAEGNRSSYRFLKPVLGEVVHRPLRAAFYYKLGMLDELMKLIEEFEESENYAELRCAAAFASSERKWKKCFELLVRLRDLAPSIWAEDEVDLHLFVVGGMMLDQGDEVVGMDLFLEAKRKFGGSKNCLKRKWEISQLLKDDPDYAPSLRASSRVKRSRVGRSERVQFLWKAGRENEALGMLIRKLEAGGAGGFQIHSWVRRELGKLDGAGFEGLLSHPLMRESMDPKLLSIAGSLADEEGRKEEARRFYERALEIDPRDIEALIWKFKMVEENEVDWTIFKGVGSVDLIRHLLGVDHVDQITNQLGERECGALVYFVKHLPDEVRQSQLLRWLFKACWLKPEIAPVILKEMVSYPRFAAKTASSLEKLEEGGLIERGVVVEILNEGILKAGNRKVVNLYFERLLRLGQEDLESKFSEAVLTHMKRVSPFRYQSYVVTEAMSQAGADVDGLFRGWREGLPEEKWLRVTVIRDFTAWLIIRDLSLGEWWKEHQILLSEVVTDDRFYNEGGLDLRSWLGWIHRKLGQDGVTQSLINFAEVTIGPSSEWKTLRKLNWQEVPAQYVKGAHEFWMLFTHLSRDEALVPLIELAFEDQRLSEVSAIMKAGLK